MVILLLVGLLPSLTKHLTKVYCRLDVPWKDGTKHDQGVYIAFENLLTLLLLKESGIRTEVLRHIGSSY